MPATAMRGNRLPGIDNQTLRRRIKRAERAIIPEMLRVFEPRRRGDAFHAIHAADPAAQPPLHWAWPASAPQTPIGAQLVLPSDHPAAPWLSTSWTVPALAGPLPDVPMPGQSVMPPTLPSSDAACWRGHGTHGTNPAPQPPTLHAAATTAATLGPKNERRQTDADPDAVHTSVARAESPATDFARFALAPLEDSVARAASISTDFTRVTSAENRAFARLLSSSAHDTRPGFLVQVGGAGAKASDACDFCWAVQAEGGIEESMESGHRLRPSVDLARLTSEEDRTFAHLLSDGVRFPRLGSESWHPLA